MDDNPSVRQRIKDWWASDLPERTEPEPKYQKKPWLVALQSIPPAPFHILAYGYLGRWWRGLVVAVLIPFGVGFLFAALGISLFAAFPLIELWLFAGYDCNRLLKSTRIPDDLLE